MPDHDAYLEAIKKELQAGHRQWRRGDKLLEAFGYTRRRQTAIDLIENRLKAKGMFTVPELTTSMPLDRGITFYLEGSKVEEVSQQEPSEVGSGMVETIVLASDDDSKGTKQITVTIPEEPPSADEGTTGERSLIIGNLACAERAPLQISPSETVEKALTEMALREYSQLVVITGQRTIRGIISYRSVAQAFLHGNPKTVNDCLDKSVPMVERNEPLLKVIERFNEFDVVLVVGPDKGPAGIVTPADIAAEFGAMAAPFFLVGQIEEQLRWLVKDRLDLSSAMAAVTTSMERVEPRSVSDLTMGDLHLLLSNDENWKKVGIKFDRVAFCRELDAVRDIRNAVMHFRDLPDGATERVKQFAGIVQTAYLAAAKQK